jgi:WD40 repeat protein
VARRGDELATTFGQTDRDVIVWNMGNQKFTLAANNGAEFRRQNFENVSIMAAFSKFGDYAATSAGLDGVIRVFGDRASQELRLPVPRGTIILGVAISLDAQYIAATTTLGTVFVFQRAETGFVLHRRLCEVCHIAAFSADARYLAMAGVDGATRITDLNSGRELLKVDADAQVTALNFSSDGSVLYVGTKSGLVQAFASHTGQRVSAGRVQMDAAVSELVLSPDRRYIGIGSVDGYVTVLDVLSHRTILQVRHNAEIASIAFSADGRYVATGGRDKVVQIFALAEDGQLWDDPSNSHIVALASPSYVALGQGKAVRVLKALDGDLFASAENSEELSTIALSPDARYLAIGGFVDQLRLAELLAKRELFASHFAKPVEAIAFSNDSRAVEAGSLDGSVIAFVTSTGHQLFSTDKIGLVGALAFSMDARRLAIAGFNETQVFDLDTGAQLTHFGEIIQEPTRRYAVGSSATSVCFSSDGTIVVVGLNDGTLEMLKVADGSRVSQLKYQSAVDAIVLSKSGTLLATATSEGTIRIVETQHWSEIARIEMNGDVFALRFDEQERQLTSVSRSSFGTRVQNHIVRSADLIADACQRVGRNLSADEWAQFIGGPYAKTCPNLP